MVPISESLVMVFEDLYRHRADRWDSNALRIQAVIDHW